MTSGFAGVSSVATVFSTTGAGVISAFGASVVATGAAGVAGVAFSVVGAVSSFSSLVGGVTSPVVWTAG